MRSILFIVNPISGGKSKERFLASIPGIIGTGADWSMAYTKGPGDATLIARDCNADVVVAVGGDGTVNEVAKGLLGTDKAMGIIPFGSGNGLARHLGLSMNKAKALRNIIEGEAVTIDHATINGLPFFCTCGVGMDAAVGMEFSKQGRRGLPTYILSSLKVWKRYIPERYRITIDGRTIEQSASIITVGNADQWGNDCYITPEASLCDGLLDIAVASPFKLYQLPLLAWQLITKRLNRSRVVKFYRGTEVTIERESSGETHFDGEPLILGDKLDIRIHPASLNVIVPKGRRDRI